MFRQAEQVKICEYKERIQNVERADFNPLAQEGWRLRGTW